MNDRIHDGAPAGESSTRWRPEVLAFIEAHRRDGHRSARLDPLGLSRPADPTLLDPQRFGLNPGDWLSPRGTPLWSARTVGDLDRALKAIYCGGLALDASAVRDASRRDWLHHAMESAPPGAGGAAERLALLDRLIRAQGWEQHVAQAFPHAKRFSLEGNETLIPLLDALCEAAAGHGVRRVFLGMPHRGRVNVLVNLMGFPPARVLDFFDPKSPHPELHTDLIYHLGGERELDTPQGRLTLTLAHNPSHLQSVHPVLTGLARACQDALGRERADQDGRRLVLPLMLHGDAAFAGQGVVMETLMLGGKPGYTVGGTVHVIINNQVGFTEPNPMSAWPAQYCTDVTRMVDAPVLRVNADEPEQALRAAAIALDWRARFGSDIVIDLIGYRRLGHSESDVPALTRPRIHALMQTHPTIVDRYADALRADRVLPPGTDMASHVTRSGVRAHQAFSDPRIPEADDAPSPLRRPGEVPPLDLAGLQALVDPMTRLPDGFEPHAMVRTLTDHWRRMAALADPPLRADWCFAENLAYATILQGGLNVRISGMDVRRGTFLHRQAVWTSQTTASTGPSGEGVPTEFVPLRQIGGGNRDHGPDAERGGARGEAPRAGPGDPSRGRFDIFNSPLSEEAVLGFEYGYSVGAQRTLTVWEAQFGDFVNGAQVFVDQYISSGEEKWGDTSSLVMLLPHGNEGIGPDHSSGYLSRFLQLCGEDNLRVACPSTAAQWFHLLRRQAFDTLRKPLVVMSPKGTLYHEKASHAEIADLTTGGFQPVIDDAAVERPAQIERLLLCSGKVHHDLERGRRSVARADLALARIEQFYPFPAEELTALFARYPGLVEITWVQEEHRQQGAWTFIREQMDAVLPQHVPLRCVARRANGSGATSSHAIHQLEQVELVARALGEI
ncbi:thiamine pyrophosphate-dependent enzyme [Roseateles chitinivorans]|uniref:thiamine pyrophosphate-dependent enzyme n=1 Tax=Roseateles chitinivorans TaxID=2917965 RepID=UPI003D67EBD7